MIAVAVLPVPANVTDRPAPKVRIPDAAPCVMGVNVTETEHMSPGASVVPCPHEGCCANGPVIAMGPKRRAPLPVFDRVTVWEEEIVPTV
jgi:hypothetical protein